MSSTNYTVRDVSLVGMSPHIECIHLKYNVYYLRLNRWLTYLLFCFKNIFRWSEELKTTFNMHLISFSAKYPVFRYF